MVVLMDILVLYYSISRGLCGLVSVGVYGSVSANLMNFSTELAGEWRYPWDSRMPGQLDLPQRTQRTGNRVG